MWRSSIQYLTTDWCCSAATISAVSSSVQKNSLLMLVSSSVLTFLFIFFICFSIPKKQTNWVSIPKENKKLFFFFLLLSPDLILVKIHSKSVDFNQIINVKQDLHIWSIMLFLLLMSGFSHPCTLSCSAIFFCMAFKSFECCVTWTKIRRHHTSVSVRTISPPASLAMTRLTKSGELSSLGRMVMGNLCLMFYLPSNILKTA